jgi:guanosine-3',5'-bis(diphosphate) 3'-pyrophosphohydrolase
VSAPRCARTRTRRWVRRELEDPAVPKRYDEINWLVEDHLPQENRLLHRVTQHTATDLRSARIKADVAGRPKHLYAIHQQMLERLHAGGRLAVSAPASR